ncbi:TROVE domain-containing protein [Actinopolymorpha sp. B9G3]|uniref:TROVE domain-containing protein n=1 Tax=Actinopolymorpha sp. B9G3 TaxID=3158970 RepID=UPI0032D964EA
MGATVEGAPGYGRDARGELFLLSVVNMVGEDTFYEVASDRDARFRALVGDVAGADPDWLGRFLPWLRREAHMRTAPIVAALEAARTMAPSGVPGSRQIVSSVLQRADEPGEALAYWMSRYGRAIPKPVKRGIADAVRRLYTERSLLKYDTDAKGFRFGDVIDLVHPTPAADKPWQGDLFAHALDRRHGRENILPDSLPTLRARRDLMGIPVELRRGLVGGDLFRLSGMTWEALAGWLQGPMDAHAWESVLPDMGYMARLRNLRNFDDAGVSDEVAAAVAAQLADREQVARSRQLPMRFLSAYRAAPSLRWAHALETALGHSLGNVPQLSGRTLILVDQSWSMSGQLSGRSQLTCADAATVFGAALALRCVDADLVQFDDSSARVRFRRRDSILRIVERFWGPRGGTNTAEAVRSWYKRHDRVVIVTDEQTWGGYHGQEPTRQVPADVPVYTWNLAGYRHGHGPSGGGNRHTFGGLTDQAFRMVPLLEAGRNADWPF